MNLRSLCAGLDTVVIFAAFIASAPPGSAQVSSVVKLLSTPNPVVQGQPVTFTAGVNLTGAAWATGTITLSDTVVCPGATAATVAVLGTITLGSASSATPGTGTLAVSSFPCAGDNFMVATYGGDSNYSPGASQASVETVLAQFAPTNVTLSSSMNPAAVSQGVTFSAQLSYVLAANTFPSGTVTFSDTNTGNVLGMANVQTAGAGKEIVTRASITTSTLAAGSHMIAAAYSGSNIYAPSTSQVLNQVVNGAAAIPSISAVVSATGFGGAKSVTPAGWIEIYGSNLAGASRSWAPADFNGANAPTSLDGTSVTIGGQPAFIAYINGGQVNAQAPSNVAPGPQPVIVTTTAGASAAYTVMVAQRQPGLLAPAAFLVSGKQYVDALFPDGTTFVLPPGLIAGLNARRAKPGDTIVLYGIGFGDVMPNIPAGRVVQESNTLAASVQFMFGDVAAQVTYAGLASGYVGLYQFNVTVPNVPASDTVPLTFSLAGISSTQSLYIAVQNP